MEKERGPWVPELIWLSAISKYAPTEEWRAAACQVRLVLAMRRDNGVQPQEKFVPFDRHAASGGRS